MFFSIIFSRIKENYSCRTKKSEVFKISIAVDRAGHGTLCTAPCPQFFNFDRASLRRLGAALYDGQKPV